MSSLSIWYNVLSPKINNTPFPNKCKTFFHSQIFSSPNFLLFVILGESKKIEIISDQRRDDNKKQIALPAVLFVILMTINAESRLNIRCNKALKNPKTLFIVSWEVDKLTWSEYLISAKKYTNVFSRFILVYKEERLVVLLVSFLDNLFDSFKHETLRSCYKEMLYALLKPISIRCCGEQRSLQKKIWLQIGLSSALNLNNKQTYKKAKESTQGDGPRTLFFPTTTVNINSFRFPFNARISLKSGLGLDQGKTVIINKILLKLLIKSWKVFGWVSVGFLKNDNLVLMMMSWALDNNLMLKKYHLDNWYIESSSKPSSDQRRLKEIHLKTKLKPSSSKIFWRMKFQVKIFFNVAEIASFNASFTILARRSKIINTYSVRRNYHTKSSEKLNFRENKNKRKKNRRHSLTIKIVQHSFYLFSREKIPSAHFKFHERESWSSSILLHYILLLTLTLLFFLSSYAPCEWVQPMQR